MKKIVKECVPVTQIVVKDLPPHPIIGIQIEHGAKGWLQCLDYRGNQYQALTVDNGISRGNRWFTTNGSTCTIEQWSEWSLRGHPAELFLFNSEKELFAWLAQ